MSKYIIREVAPEMCEFNFYFDDDGLTERGGDWGINEMPLLIIIGIIIIIHNARKPKKRKQHYFPAPPVYDPVKIERLNAAQEKEAEKKRREYKREQEKALKQREQADKAEQEKAQALDDISFYQSQISRQREMLKDANRTLKVTRATLKESEEIEAIAPGAVSVKILEKQRRERDKALRRVITLENQLHGMETKLGKAYYKANT